MNIKLQIDRLVLDGIHLSYGQQQLLQASVINELTRLLSKGRLAPDLARGITLDRLHVTGIQLTDNHPVRLGQQIAQSVYGGIGRE